jgi:putative chitinase
MASQLQPSNRPKMRPKGVGAKNKTMSKEEQALYDYAISQGIVGEELASFMAQTAHESTSFSKVKESGLSKKNIQDILDGNAPNLDPSGKVRLRFIEDGITASSGAVAANNSRYRDGVGPGNKDYSSGDGSKFAGKGYIQVTGRSNYKKLGEAMGVDLVNNPDLLLDRDFARKASVQWWKDNVRPKNPNYSDTRAVTKIVNGGYTGLEDREERASAYFRDMADANVNNPDEFDPRKAKFNSFGTEGLTPAPTPSSSAPETSPRPQARPMEINSAAIPQAEGYGSVGGPMFDVPPTMGPFREGNPTLYPVPAPPPVTVTPIPNTPNAPRRDPRFEGVSVPRGVPDSPRLSDTFVGVPPVTPVVAEPLAVEQAVMQASPMQQVPQPTQSFNEAFSAGRAAAGGDGGTFMYNDKLYNTNLAKYNQGTGQVMPRYYAEGTGFVDFFKNLFGSNYNPVPGDGRGSPQGVSGLSAGQLAAANAEMDMDPSAFNPNVIPVPAMPAMPRDNPPLPVVPAGFDGDQPPPVPMVNPTLPRGANGRGGIPANANENAQRLANDIQILRNELETMPPSSPQRDRVQQNIDALASELKIYNDRGIGKDMRVVDLVDNQPIVQQEIAAMSKDVDMMGESPRVNAERNYIKTNIGNLQSLLPNASPDELPIIENQISQFEDRLKEIDVQTRVEQFKLTEGLSNEERGDAVKATREGSPFPGTNIVPSLNSPDDIPGSFTAPGNEPRVPPISERQDPPVVTSEDPAMDNREKALNDLELSNNSGLSTSNDGEVINKKGEIKEPPTLAEIDATAEGLGSDTDTLLGKLGPIFKSLFGLETQDLTRALGFYLMSRASGASHEGSMRWAGGTVLKQAETRNAKNLKTKEELAKDNKTIKALVDAGYTEASARSYVQTKLEDVLKKSGSGTQGSYPRTGQSATLGITGVPGLSLVQGFEVDSGTDNIGKYNVYRVPTGKPGEFIEMTEDQLSTWVNTQGGQTQPYDKAVNTTAGRQAAAIAFTNSLQPRINEMFSGKDYDDIRTEAPLAFAAAANFMQDKMGYTFNDPGVQSNATVVLMTAMEDMRDDMKSGRVKDVNNAAPYIKRAIMSSASLGAGQTWLTSDGKGQIDATKTNGIWQSLSNINSDPGVIKTNFKKLYQTYALLKKEGNLPSASIDKNENEFYVFLHTTLANKEYRKTILGE